MRLHLHVQSSVDRMVGCTRPRKGCRRRRLRGVLNHLTADGTSAVPPVAAAGTDPLELPLILRRTPLSPAHDVICGAAHIQHRLQEEANAMVARCLELGVEEFDTAANYGDSERALGIALRASGRPPTAYRVHTKIAGTEPRFPKPDWSAAAAELTYAESFALLGPITSIRAHGLRHADRPSPNSPRLRDWCAPLDQALLPGLGEAGGLFAGLRDLRSRGKIERVSLGMDTGNAAAGQRDVRALGIIDLIREAPTVRPP